MPRKDYAPIIFLPFASPWMGLCHCDISKMSPLVHPPSGIIPMRPKLYPYRMTHSLTSQSNSTFQCPVFFILTGIPGLGDRQTWLTLVFGPMYLLALLGNATLLTVIRIDSTLHQSMFLLLATLAATDLGLATSIAPGLLAVLWFGPNLCNTLSASSRCSLYMH